MDDLDNPWKEALDFYFEQSMALLFPFAHGDIDWSRGYESLDTELQAIVRDSEQGHRLVDKLVKVWRKDGQEEWVLIHLEVQSQEESEFPRRMFVYNYRVFDRYNQTVVSLAVLGDDRSNWRPDRFGYSMWGCEVGIRFPKILLHWRQTPMPYITSVERIGMEKGLQQGRCEGIVEAIEYDLDMKFGDQGLSLLPQIKAITDLDQLRTIMHGLKKVKTLDEARQLLN